MSDWRARAKEEKDVSSSLRELCHESLGHDRRYDVRVVLYPREPRTTEPGPARS